MRVSSLRQLSSLLLLWDKRCRPWLSLPQTGCWIDCRIVRNAEVYNAYTSAFSFWIPASSVCGSSFSAQPTDCMNHLVRILRIRIRPVPQKPCDSLPVTTQEQPRPAREQCRHAPAPPHICSSSCIVWVSAPARYLHSLLISGSSLKVRRNRFRCFASFGRAWPLPRPVRNARSAA